ncbi:MAG: HesA/MoeB/ThiF family protein [Zymomonas mobilis subsp. pomaceae]|uniref:HesA/MoeB/ThiF family protein n=1 Tax=Zymomonas mobilis TaxID=542 RepID=UPI0039E90854
MNLTETQLDRYARHIVLPEIGGKGQKKLLAAHVAIVGAGGIGSPVIQYLAAAGVGRLTIIDDDEVSLSNLQRQTLFATRDVGAHKVAMAANVVQRLNPDVKIVPYDQRLTSDNARDLLDKVDVIVDGSDNFGTRLAISDMATELAIPLVSAAVHRFEAQLAVFKGYESDKPCYRCFVGDDPGEPEMTCAAQGVLGALTGTIGSLAAVEAIRLLTGFGKENTDKLLLIDAKDFRFRTVRLAKEPNCQCSRHKKN